MTGARSSGSRGRIAKIAVAGMLLGLPAAAVSIPAYAAPADTPSVLPAPLPADPPTDAPQPPPPPPPPPAPQRSAYTDDWWGPSNNVAGNW
jgi:hypothetical protein